MKRCKKTTIFIVEDDSDIQLLYGKVFKSSGFQVIGISDNGEDALDKFKSFSEKLDIIIMDYNLPFKNGLEIAIEIIRIHNELKIIFVSANDDIKDISLTIGAVKFLNKPFEIRKLIETINHVIRS